MLPCRRKIHTDVELNDTLPFFSIIITAYNEQDRIEKKIRNTLELDYPQDRCEILVASDGSTDATASLVKTFQDQGVKLIEVEERKGKENAQLKAIEQARGEILVFSDVATIIPENGLQRLYLAFRDPKIGAVSSEDKFINQNGELAGEGAYIKYEMWLRKLESRTYSLVGLSGSFFACRNEICKHWDISIPSDFNSALNCVSQGYIAVSDNSVLGYYQNLQDETREYARKLRTVIRGISALYEKRGTLNPFRYGMFSFFVFSHKLMRWLVPIFLIILFLSNIYLLNDSVLYSSIMLAQIAFYTLAMTGWLVKSARNHNLVKIPYFFIQVNLAILHAELQFLAGKRITKWEPSKR